MVAFPCRSDAEILEPATSAPGTYLASDRAQQQVGGSGNPFSSMPTRTSSSAAGQDGKHRIAGDTVIIHIRCKKSDAPFTVVVTGPVSDSSVEAIDQLGWAGVAAVAPLKTGRLAAADMPELERTWIEQALATCGNDRDAAIRWLADHARELITGTGVGAEDATDMLRVSRGIYHGVTSAFELSLHTGQLYLRRREVVPVPQVRSDTNHQAVCWRHHTITLRIWPCCSCCRRSRAILISKQCLAVLPRPSAFANPPRTATLLQPPPLLRLPQGWLGWLRRPGTQTCLP